MNRSAYIIISFIIISCSGGGELNNATGGGQSSSPSIPPVVVEVTNTPTVAGTTPVSPAINNSPTVDGTTEANATVNIYSDSACTALVATGTADGAGAFSITDTLLGGTSQSYYAQATATGKSVSLCSSTTVTYQNNSIRPGLAWLSGTQTTAPGTPTQINQAIAYGIEWSSSELDSAYYSHSTVANTEVLNVLQAGDYWVSATLPLIMTAGTYRPSVRIEARVNGALVPGAVGESSYIRFDGATGNLESSSHISILLRALSINDTIEIFAVEAAGDDGSEVVSITSVASLLVEFVSATRDLFTATATRTVSNVNINQGAASQFEWAEDREDGSFTHDDVLNPENIVFAQGGDYLVSINVPINSLTADRTSPFIKVLLNAVTVDGGQACQGYARGDSNHFNSSIHWTGLVRGVSPADTLTVTSEQGAIAGSVTIQGGGAAHITAEKIDSTRNVLSLRATALTGGTNWNPAAKDTIMWDVSDISDATVYSHSTVLNPHQITVASQGDYQIIYNDVLSGANDRVSPHIKIQVNGVDVPGAETKTHYIRNTSGHNESSASLVFLLRNLSAGDIITITSEQETAAGTVNDVEDTLLTIIKK